MQKVEASIFKIKYRATRKLEMGKPFGLGKIWGKKWGKISGCAPVVGLISKNNCGKKHVECLNKSCNISI